MDEIFSKLNEQLHISRPHVRRCVEKQEAGEYSQRRGCVRVVKIR